MNTYPLGAVVRANCAFTTNSAADDPTTVQAKIRTPSGTITAYIYGTDAQLIRDSIGNYHVDISATAAGVWSYRFIGTGTGQAANETEFYVQASDFGTTG